MRSVRFASLKLRRRQFHRSRQNNFSGEFMVGAQVNSGDWIDSVEVDLPRFSNDTRPSATSSGFRSVGKMNASPTITKKHKTAERLQHELKRRQRSCNQATVATDAPAAVKPRKSRAAKARARRSITRALGDHRVVDGHLVSNAPRLANVAVPRCRVGGRSKGRGWKRLRGARATARPGRCKRCAANQSRFGEGRATTAALIAACFWPPYTLTT